MLQKMAVQRDRHGAEPCCPGLALEPGGAFALLIRSAKLALNRQHQVKVRPVLLYEFQIDFQILNSSY